MANNFSRRTNTEFVKWEDFYPYVRPMAQDCPISIVDAAIRAACIEFCSKSLIWNVETICGDMTAGERVYKYNNKNDQISNVMPICCIIRDVRVGDKPEDHFAYPTNLQDLDYYEPNWRLSEAPFPKRFYMKDPNTIVFVENPTETVPHGIHLLCAVKPNRKAEGVAEFIFQDWAEEIASGALYRIHSMAGRVWANPGIVQLHYSKFRAGISRAKSKMYKSHVAQSKTMLPKMTGNTN